MEPPPLGAPLQLVFRGECQKGIDPQGVRHAVASALKLDEKRTAHLFSGRRVVLRRAVDAHAARRWVTWFEQMGAVLYAEPSQVQAVRNQSVPVTDDSAGHPRSNRGLRWVGIAGVGVVGALMLALGPGLSSLWSDPPAESIAAPLTVAAARPEARAPVLPAPATDVELPQDMSADALHDFRQHYLPALNHKAFAISSGGGHAWQAAAASENEARERALAACMAALRPGDNACRVVDADGSLE